MGRFVKQSVLSAYSVTSDGSPVLTVNNSQFTNVLYVAKNGSDLNDGKSLATPFLTIKAALTAATSGTAIRVSAGTYQENNPLTVPANVAILGDSIRSVFIEPSNPLSDFFLLNAGTYIWGVTVQNYESTCFSYDPAATTVFVSPYIQNITSSTTSANATCVLIDGSISGSTSTKAMILGFMTIINRNGTGVRLINQAYSQAVNIYTIAANVGIKIESGSFATINGCDSSIGNYGIWAEGKSPVLYTGNVQANADAGNSSVTISNMTSFPRTNNGLIFDTDPTIYYIDTATNLSANTYLVNLTTRLGNTIAANTGCSGYAVSTVSASAHTFEYVGAGTNPANALPQYGGMPIQEHEVVEVDGARVNFTSTDQKGDFRIGPGLVINRASGTIEGDDFDRSLFSVLTPYILAIEG